MSERLLWGDFHTHSDDVEHGDALLAESRERVRSTFGLQVDEVQNPDAFFHNARKVKIHRTVPRAAYAVEHSSRGVPLELGVNSLYVRVSRRNRDYDAKVPAGRVASLDPEQHLWGLDHVEHILGASVTSR